MRLSIWDAYDIGWYIQSLCLWARGVEVRMSELSDKLVAVTAQLSKARNEVVGKIDELTAALEAAQVDDPDVAQALADLQTAAQAMDDVVPDPAPPAEETPAE
ncbi:hypothetical protein [Mycobacterium phage WXIN]|nr:hypothetical protein [Mycobacterium phage WXIN]